MRIVIDIPEEVFDAIYNQNYYAENVIHKAIKNGEIIQKGCGRLIDADKTLSAAWKKFHAHEDEWQKKDPDYILIGRFYEQNGFECCQQAIVNAPTIIEADTARDCKTCGYSNSGKCSYTEECHECMFVNKYVEAYKESEQE